mmetsp:Transcript_20187/g.49656  ORF Transcript_20187/g.49656 Transcript_20187/m.49656 type:complete len:207 (+) Transcript_20187:419-1039(+)
MRRSPTCIGSHWRSSQRSRSTRRDCTWSQSSALAAHPGRPLGWVVGPPRSRRIIKRISPSDMECCSTSCPSFSPTSAVQSSGSRWALRRSASPSSVRATAAPFVVTTFSSPAKAHLGPRLCRARSQPRQLVMTSASSGLGQTCPRASTLHPVRRGRCWCSTRSKTTISAPHAPLSTRTGPRDTTATWTHPEPDPSRSLCGTTSTAG